ncbi:hypothetical protein NPIL_22271 [Nephila pilipes]|uniref:Uncharacterized protein n=1 Tax=Nephila pilipes TaxID=299642 RepID=A0A8X6UGW7_NEPPI|nr:hypothetical protein NPIL_571411 [Nephila pilipes]GFU23968.1 hypothetical protein NPIL_22271 [Nephila pilipes]
MSRTGNLMVVSRTIVSRVTTAYTKLGKVSSAKKDRGEMSKLTSVEEDSRPKTCLTQMMLDDITAVLRQLRNGEIAEDETSENENDTNYY